MPRAHLFPTSGAFLEAPMSSSPASALSSCSSREMLPTQHGHLSQKLKSRLLPGVSPRRDPWGHLILTFVVLCAPSLALKETDNKIYKLLRGGWRVTFFYRPSKALAPCLDLSQELYVPENWLPSHLL